MFRPLEGEARGHLIMLYLILGARKRDILQCFLVKHGGHSQKLWPVSIFYTLCCESDTGNILQESCLAHDLSGLSIWPEARS